MALGNFFLILLESLGYIETLNFFSLFDDNVSMNTFKNKTIFFIFSLLITSCVPDSLTKFKEDSVIREEPAEVVSDVIFKDEEDNVITASEMIPPTSLSYTDKIFIAGETDALAPDSSGLNDITPISSTALQDNAYENYLPRYTITPSLPTGLFLNPKTGYISGTLTSATPVVMYVVTLTYRDPSTLTDTTLTEGTLYISAEEKIPDDFRITFGDTITTKRMGLKLENSSRFKLAGVTKIAALSGAQGDILSYDDDDFVYIDITSAAVNFKSGDLVDNSLTYISKETSVLEEIFYFETSEITPNIELKPLASSLSALSNATNNVTYEISPDLPSNLSLNSTTGIISGYVTESQSSTEYTYTIKNNSFSKSYAFNLAIVNPPTLLAYSNLKVFQVSNASRFKVGNNITSSPIAPSIEFGKGIVRYVIDAATDYLVVEVTEESAFKKDQAIDNASTFLATEAIILDTPESLTSIIQVADASGFSDYNNIGAALPSHIICQTDNASSLQHGKAVITKIVGNQIFAMQSKGINAGEYPGYFRDNAAYSVLNTTGCDALNIGTTSNSVVQKVWSPSIVAAVDSSAAFIKGLDIISNSLASGYVSKLISATEMELKVNSQTEFDNGQTLDADKPYDAVNATIASIYTNMKFELERGVETNISAFLLKGDDLVFTISPDLPEGLSINQSTGAISGTPTKATSEATYQITAKNVIGSQTIQVNIHVQDFFSILDATAVAPSYIMHKAGQANNYSQCRISKDDIDEYSNNLADTRPIDITCFLEGGELDIYDLGVKVQAAAGPSVCEFINYEPYYFMQYKPAKTANTSFAVMDSVSCDFSAMNQGDIYLNSALAVADIPDGTDFDFKGAASRISVDSEKDLCQALYEDGSINCDTGKVTFTTYSVGTDLNDSDADPDTIDSECSYTETGTRVVQCSGKISACIGGPIKDLLTDQQISDGIRYKITPSNSGIAEEYAISSPSTLGHDTNKYIVNEFTNYQCTTPGAASQYLINSDGLINYANEVNTIADYIDPVKGSNPFYTFNCLDSAREIKARVRLIIREWDRNFKQEDQIDSFIPGNVLRNTDASDLLGNPYNEYFDWTNGKLADSGLGHTPSYTACNAAGTFSNGAQALSGTFAGVALERTVTGTGTFFTEELGVGNIITLGGTPYTIRQIVDDQELIVNEVITTGFAGVAGTKRSITHFPGDDL